MGDKVKTPEDVKKIPVVAWIIAVVIALSVVGGALNDWFGFFDRFKSVDGPTTVIANEVTTTEVSTLQLVEKTTDRTLMKVSATEKTTTNTTIKSDAKKNATKADIERFKRQSLAVGEYLEMIYVDPSQRDQYKKDGAKWYTAEGKVYHEDDYQEQIKNMFLGAIYLTRLDKNGHLLGVAGTLGYFTVYGQDDRMIIEVLGKDNY